MKIFLLILLFLFIAVISFIVFMCLKLITRPIRYSHEEMRKEEIKNGFASSVLKYENEWNREPFELSVNGIKIDGEIIRNPKAVENKTVIVCHGQKVNRYCSIKYAEMFMDLGYNIVLYDERYFGKSGGEFSTLGQEEAKDLKEVYTYTKKVFGEDCKIGLHGESMGAATSLLSLKYIKPIFVVADCPFSDSYRLYEEFTRKNVHLPPIMILPFVCLIAKHKYGYDIRKTSPIEAVRQSDVPICFMHGTADGLIKHEHSEAMYEACKNKLSQIHLFEGADHARSVFVDTERYKKILNDFVRECEKGLC